MKWLKRVGAVIAALALILGYGILLWKGPWLFDGNHIRKRNLQPADGVVITGFRTMVVAVGAGVLAALGVYYTHRNHKLARAQFDHTQQQFELAQQQFKHAQDQFEYQQQKDRESAQAEREARVTEQYVAAVKLLASSSDTERLGAIYSLERIMRDSPRDSKAIETLLATFIREREASLKEQKAWARPGQPDPEPGADYWAAVQVLKEWQGTA
ncbi:hypothetical protein ELQ39_27955 [Streptomyces sp. GB4-14]|uniref:hypothetical protein n=1 Tax=Streptomyces sp. GB4-14 TaxID=2498703 RepID=UPI001F5EDEA2|nr:hypothetical protein [Streptomyces sp. GB4-14]